MIQSQSLNGKLVEHEFHWSMWNSVASQRENWLFAANHLLQSGVRVDVTQQKLIIMVMTGIRKVAFVSL